MVKEFLETLKQRALQIHLDFQPVSKALDEFLTKHPSVTVLAATITFCMTIFLGRAVIEANAGAKPSASSTPVMTTTEFATTTTSVTTTATSATTETTPTATTAMETATAITTTAIIPPNVIAISQPQTELQAYIDRTTQKYAKFKKLYGIDISKYQRNSYERNIPFADHFVIMRVSGNLGIDKYCDTFVNEAKSQDKLLGWYFFTDSQTWSEKEPTEYARWCADQCEGYLGWGIFVLDAEVSGNVIDTAWCEKWLNSFEEYTGVTPFLYINEASERKNNWHDTNVPNRFPLWVAKYGPNNGSTIKQPRLNHWESAIIQQYASLGEQGHLDQDVFYATVEDWWSYARQKQ